MVVVIWNLLPLGYELVKYLEFVGSVSVPVSCLYFKDVYLFAILRRLYLYLYTEKQIL